MSGAPPPGAQPERTALAWTRSAAALLVGALVGLRVSVDRLSPVAVVGFVAAAALALVAVVVASRRHRGAPGEDTRGWRNGSGTLPALVTVTTLALAAAALATVLG